MDFDKIVRDNIAAIITRHGRKFITRQVGDREAVYYLIKKLHEEADEIYKAWDGGEGEGRMIEELADVMECVRGIASKMSVLMDRIDWERENKAIQNGRFETNTILVSMEGDKF
ncbi:MAG: nucleoside triphosphate pyrophosphohydrolase [Chloroflexota bacterium]